MTRFVQLQTLSSTIVAVNPEHVALAQEFDSGRGGIGTTLKLVNGDTLNVRGTLAETLEKLGANQ
ncbi:MAG: hypothetical protein ACTHQM_04955 [Thermoanaerobaculia bacterium]